MSNAFFAEFSLATGKPKAEEGTQEINSQTGESKV